MNEHQPRITLSEPLRVASGLCMYKRSAAYRLKDDGAAAVAITRLAERWIGLAGPRTRQVLAIG